VIKHQPQMENNHFILTREVSKGVVLIPQSIPEVTKRIQWSSLYDGEIYKAEMENEKRYYHNLYEIRIYQEEGFEKMRCILVNWMIEVQVEFKLQIQTLYLAVNYMDRVLLRVPTPRFALQLLGTTSLFIASKYEEIYPPDIEKFLYVCDNTYTKQQILGMEYKVLNTLSFELTCASIKNFISILLKFLAVDENDKEINNFCHFLGELTLPIYEFRKFLPSHIASSIVCIAVYTFSDSRNNLCWTPEYERNIQYKKEDLIECIQLIYYNYKDPKKPAPYVFEKYGGKEYGGVTLTKIPDILPFF